VQSGFGTTADTNGPNPAGVGVTPSNNQDGMQMSAAITHLQPRRHCPNLTVRGGVFVRRIVFKGLQAVGVEAESGGKVFTVEADRVVLSAGAIRSPHLLMLSGIGPKDHLQPCGVPIVHELPGVGQHLWNHLSAQMTFKVKDGISLTVHADAVHFSLHYTAQGSRASNDMVLRTSPVVDARQEHVPDLRTKYLNGDVPPDKHGHDVLYAGGELSRLAYHRFMPHGLSSMRSMPSLPLKAFGQRPQGDSLREATGAGATVKIPALCPPSLRYDAGIPRSGIPSMIMAAYWARRPV
jgi:choline dehydrogenase-like flavoprotein